MGFLTRIFQKRDSTQPSWQYKSLKRSMAAVGKLTNQQELAGVIESDFSVYTSYVAAKKINDTKLAQTVFFDIICDNTINTEVQLDCLNRLTDQNLLVKLITEKDVEISTLRTAVMKLTDRSVLEQLVNTDSYVNNDIINIAKTKLMQIAQVELQKTIAAKRNDHRQAVDANSPKACSKCGVTEADFDKYYEALKTAHVFVLSKDRLITCTQCNTVICTICLHKNNGACPSCRHKM
jgi:hypothetical protein